MLPKPQMMPKPQKAIKDLVKPPRDFLETLADQLYDDWELSGEKETCKLHTVVGIRDQINNLRDLVQVCACALLHESDEDVLKERVSHVLYFFVDSKLADLELEVKKI